MERVNRGETRAWILLGLVLGLFLAAIETTVVATAMPRVIADWAASTSTVFPSHSICCWRP